MPTPVKAYVVVDLGFGDAGKGTVTDYLVRARRAHTVVRFNGGAQAAHHVQLPSESGRRPVCHPFSQFGSGTFVIGVKTYLTADVLFDPVSLIGEEAALQQHGIRDAYERFTVHEDCIVVTPFHKAANRFRELSRRNRHGSCGMGIGEAMQDNINDPEITLRVKDLKQPDLRQRLETIREYNRSKVHGFYPLADGHIDGRFLRDPKVTDWFIEQCQQATASISIKGDAYEQSEVFNVDKPGVIVCEGAQGVLLDERYGFHPYTTWSTTTPHKILDKLRYANYHHGSVGNEIEVVGVTRAFTTRHGAGPFPSACDTEETRRFLLEADDNKTHDWQGEFRVGWLDLVLLRYAIEACAVPWAVRNVDWLAVTCLDRLQHMRTVKACTAYQLPSVLDVNLLTDIPVARKPTLAGQEILTRLLQTVLTVLTPTSKAQIIRLIADECGVPVGLTSYGPTWKDKIEVPVPEPEYPLVKGLD